MLALEGLAKRYGSFEAVRDITLSVQPGELYALLGPNGAGKTTTIRMLMGVLRASAGSARVLGLDCFTQRADVMRHVGYLPDEPTFYDYLRGRELLRFVGEMHGFGAREVERRAEPWVARLGIDDALEEFAVNYSKGMKKKLALCCALLHEPELLVLDEPTNGLDPYATRALHEIAREQAAAGRSVFFTTHLLDQAERLCHRIGILHRGALAAEGTLAELRAQSAAEGGSLEEIFFHVTRADAEHADLEGARRRAATRGAANEIGTSRDEMESSGTNPGAAERAASDRPRDAAPCDATTTERSAAKPVAPESRD